MSLERRQFNLRSHHVDTVGVEPATTPLAWDEEAATRAMTQTRTLTSRDPEASQYLVTQIIAQPTRVMQVYDPIKTEAQLLIGVGLKPWEGDQMHFVRYFGLVREVVLAREKEKAEYERDLPTRTTYTAFPTT